MFDITQLNQSSFRGIPFYTRDDELTGGQRLTDHSFINGGTKTESNGIKNNTFTIKGYIGGDDYLNQKQALKEAFETIGSGILIDKFYGTLNVFVDTYKISESITRFGRADIDVTFKLAENKPIEVFDIVYTIDVKQEAISNLQNDFNNQIGADLLDDVGNDIVDFWNGVQDIIKFVEDTRDDLQNLKSQIGRVISQVKTSILSIESLTSDIQDIWSSFDEVLDFDLFGVDEQKSGTNILKELIEQSALRSSDNEAEQVAITQSQIYINTVVAGLLQTSINNLENIDFEIGDDFGSVKDDILSIMEILEKDIIIDSTKPIEEIIIKQNLLNKYQQSRKEFIQFYTQKYSKLQELKDFNIVATTNILNLTMTRYNDINRINEVLINNDIVDPLFINGDIKLLER